VFGVVWLDYVAATTIARFHATWRLRCGSRTARARHNSRKTHAGRSLRVDIKLMVLFRAHLDQYGRAAWCVILPLMDASSPPFRAFATATQDIYLQLNSTTGSGNLSVVNGGSITPTSLGAILP
jgi:hypothetical protein